MSEFLQYTPDDTNKYSPENIEAAKSNASLRFSPFDASVNAFFNKTNFIEATAERSKMFLLGMDPKEEKFEPDEIKKQFDIDTDEPLNKSQIELLQMRQDRERKADFMLSNMDPYAAGRSFFPIASGLANGLVDPLALSTGMVIDKGLSAVLNMSKIAKLTSSIINSPAKNLAAGVTRGATSGLAEAYLDDYTMKAHADQFGLQYTAADSFLNMGLSTVAGGLLGGLGAGLDNVQTRRFRQAQEAMNSFEAGKQPKDFYVKAYDNDRYRRYSNGTTNEPPLNPKGPTEGTFYGSFVSETGDLNFKTNRTFGTKLGEGVVFTNNRDFAFNESTGSIEGNGGQLVEVNAENLNLLNIDEPLPDFVKEVVKKELRDLNIKGPDVDELLSGRRSTKEVLEFIGEISESKEKYNGLINAVNKKIRESGDNLDGYSFRHSDSEGQFVGGDQDGAVFLFDPDRVTARGVEQVDSRYSGFRTPLEEQAQQYLDYFNSRESHLFYDSAVDDAFESIDPAPVVRDPVQDIPVIQRDIADFDEQFELNVRDFEERADVLEDLLGEREYIVNIAEELELPTPSVAKLKGFAFGDEEALEFFDSIMLNQEDITAKQFFRKLGASPEILRLYEEGDFVDFFINILRDAAYTSDNFESYRGLQSLNDKFSEPKFSQNFEVSDAIPTNDIDKPLPSVSSVQQGSVTLSESDLRGFKKLKDFKPIEGAEVTHLDLGTSPEGVSSGTIFIWKPETRESLGIIEWGEAGISVLSSTDMPGLKSPFLATTLIREAVKSGAPKAVDGTISPKAAELVNALRARELQREARKQMQKSMKSVQEEIASNPQDMIEQAAKAATFCVRNS